MNNFSFCESRSTSWLHLNKLFLVLVCLLKELMLVLAHPIELLVCTHDKDGALPDSDQLEIHLTWQSHLCEFLPLSAIFNLSSHVHLISLVKYLMRKN